MMTDKYDRLLKEGLIKLKEAEFSYVPTKDNIDYEFSEKYLRSKEKLLNKIDHSYWKYINSAAKKVVVILITLIITFSSLMTVDAFRKTVSDFIVTIYQTFTKIEHKTQLNNQIKTYYSLNNLPAGYEINTLNYSESTYLQVWDNVNSKHLTLSQVPINTSNIFNSEHGEISESIINDTPCFICQDENYFFCYWEFDGYRFELIYPIDLGEKFMSEVVGNLTEVNPEDILQ